MKFNFDIDVRPVSQSTGDRDVPDGFRFEGLLVKTSTEMTPEEFMQLLPHYQEMTKIIIPFLQHLRTEGLTFFKDAAKGFKDFVGPDLLAAVRNTLDLNSEERRQRMQQQQEDHAIEMEERRNRMAFKSAQSETRGF